MSAIYNEYNQNNDEEFEEFLKWKEKRLKEQGIGVGASLLGDSIHEKTIESYNKIKQEPPDTPYLAVRRHLEKQKKILASVGRNPEITTIIRKVFRLKDKNTGNEYLAYNYEERFKDNNDNVQQLEYINVGTHPEVEGKVHRDANYAITGSEITRKKIIFDIPWSSKEFDNIMKQHNSAATTNNGTEPNTEFIVGYARTEGHRTVLDNQEKYYLIRNMQDFKQGTHKELYELGQRGLSEVEPSLKKVSQSVAEDPSNSLHKQARGYIPIDKISYTQTSYR